MMTSFHAYDTSSMNTAATDTRNDIIMHPGKHDVLFGRGGAINQHVGNIMFRRVVNEQKEDYFNAPKSDKPKIARRVVNIVRNLMNPPGRFLAPLNDSDKNSKDKEGRILWYDVGDKKARAKASQCLREKKIDSPSASICEQPGFKRRYTGSCSTMQSHEQQMEDLPSPIALNTYSNIGTYNDLEEEKRASNIPYSVYPDFHHSMQADATMESRHHSTTTTIERAPVSEEVRHGHMYDIEPLNYLQKPLIAQPITPCHESNKRPRTCYAQESQHIADYHQQSQHQSSEVDLSWVGSFCSLGTRMIEEGESMSLSPPVDQQNETNHPSLLRSASWASSDVRSELTDNSHVKDFD